MLDQWEKESANCIVLDAGFAPQTAASFSGANSNTVAQSVRREKIKGRVESGKRTRDQIAATEARVLELHGRLRTEAALAGWLPKEREVPFFPGPSDSAAHLERLFGLLGRARESIDVSMYVTTHCDLASTLMAAKVSGVAMRVVADFKKWNTLGSRRHELISAEIPVHRHKSRMMHHKTVILDNKIVVFGSVNWIEHAVSRDGHVCIHTSTGPHRLKFKIQTCVATYRLLASVKQTVSCGLCSARSDRLIADTRFTDVVARVEEAVA
ncbi:Mitochondrial cardiolipin hydrolase [Globisporangium polare]